MCSDLQKKISCVHNNNEAQDIYTKMLVFKHK